MPRLCPKCGAELVEDAREYKVEKYDGQGNFTGYGTQMVSMLSCPSCYLEFDEEDPKIVDKPQKPVKQELVKPMPEAIREEQKNYGDHNFIDHFIPFISEITNVSKTPARAMLQYLVAHALSNAKYENSKGKINPNLSFIWVAPSGSNKTPLIENGISKFLYQYPVFKDFREYGQVTGKGFRQSVAKIKDDIKASINWDEASVAVKDAKNPATSDLFEVLSQAFDGKLIPYDSIRGGAERYKPLFVNIWMSGTPLILANIGDNFWYQGFGLRSLFLDYKADKPHLITDDVNGMEDKEQIYRNMMGELERMQKIKQIKTTTEFMEQYNIYQIGITEEIQKVQTDITKAMDHEVYSIISKVKYPVLVMKLAMVYSASRFNFDDKEGILTLDVEDLDRAKEDLESYHENMIDMFEAWESLNESKSKIETISNAKRKMERHIMSIINSGKSFELEMVTEHSETYFKATMKKAGKWVSRPALLKNANIKARDFDDIVETLIQQMYLAKRDARIIKEDGFETIVVFYSILKSK